MSDLLELAEANEYQQLFLRHLLWHAPDQEPHNFTDDDGGAHRLRNVSSYAGIRVWTCEGVPDSRIQVAIDRHLARTNTERLVVFYEGARQVWRWPARTLKDMRVSTRLTRHEHLAGSDASKLAARLQAIQLSAEDRPSAVALLSRISAAFDTESRNETKRASKLMAAMYEALERCYQEAHVTKERTEHEVSVTLARILFLMFGDDTDMWEPDGFQVYVGRSDGNAHALSQSITSLFKDLDTPADERPTDEVVLPYVNGKIFEEPIVLPPLSEAFRTAVLEASVVDWSTISPAIFGSMFQSVRDPKTRRKMGEHYTSEKDILKTLDPLFLTEIRSELSRVLSLKKPAASLKALWDRISRIRVLDPACGCGNFLIIAYRELRAVELQILEALQTLEQTEGQQQLNPVAADTLRVRLDHFFGIELDEWGARIAETAMFLVGRQSDLLIREAFGEAPRRLPIISQANITSGESALQLDWHEIVSNSEGHEVIIVGNPPYSGLGADRTASQVEELKSVWGESYHGSLDYVTCWFKKAADYFQHEEGRWAYVATNSICQGEPVAPLFVPLFGQGWKILFAHQSFAWTSEATGKAAVHCVIVGFSKTPRGRVLYEYETSSSEPNQIQNVPNITPYLTSGETVIVSARSKPLNPQIPAVFYGNKPSDGGGLIVKRADYERVARDTTAAKYLRRFVGTRELLHDEQRHCLWLVDASEGDLSRSAVLRDRLEHVRAKRLVGAKELQKFAETPHLFVQISHPDGPYLSIPRHVSENYPYFLAARLSGEVITSDANFMCSDPDGFAFALISSSMYLAWQKTVGGRIKSDPRFNKLVVWNTFPLPHITEPLREEIAAAGDQIADRRQAYHDGQSLSEMYDSTAISPALRASHDDLDSLIDPLFALPASPTRLTRQRALLQAYKRQLSKL